MRERIYLSSPHMGGGEFTFIQEFLRSDWASPKNPNIDGFERELAAYNNINHCAALSSGTAAIHLALIILGVKQGDEVLCATFTFSASCNPIVYVGATPVFVDSEPETWNMDPLLLEEVIIDRIKKGKRPKAIILVHLYGMPAKINEIVDVSKKYEIPIIEDAAEAVGSAYKGKKVGTFGDIGIYSFNGNKIITTSGGGALVSQNEKWVNKARFLAMQAKDAAPYYQHSEIGYNYQLSNISAGIGRGQLLVIDERVKQRRANFEYYKSNLSGAGICFQPELEVAFSNRWLTTILIDPSKCQGVTNETIRLALEKENIESRPLWKPMHLQPVFKNAPSYTNGISESFFKIGLCLPSGSILTREKQAEIISLISKI